MFDVQAVLHLAARAGRPDCVSSLVNEAGANLELRNRYGSTPLICAAAKGRSEVCACLLDAKANPEARGGFKGPDGSFHTAADWARKLGHHKVLAVFKEKEATAAWVTMGFDLGVIQEHPLPVTPVDSLRNTFMTEGEAHYITGHLGESQSILGYDRRPSKASSSLNQGLLEEKEEDQEPGPGITTSPEKGLSPSQA